MVTLEGEPICDFCGSEDVRWVYPAYDVELEKGPIIGSSLGAWAACETCHDLIESEDWETLATRSYDTSPLAPVMEKFGLKNSLRHTILLLHQAFSDARVGKPQRLPGRG